ncbi:MAG: phosphoribosylanthranilate isomerase, partial [Bacteroidota bacterium]
MIPHIKICCINSIAEVHMAIEAGASALGLVGPMPSGPGVITDELIFEIARATPPPIATFLLTSATSVME